MIARSDVGQPQWREADEPAVHDDACAARTRVYIDRAACAAGRCGRRRLQSGRQGDIEGLDRRRGANRHTLAARHVSGTGHENVVGAERESPRHDGVAPKCRPSIVTSAPDGCDRTTSRPDATAGRASAVGDDSCFRFHGRPRAASQEAARVKVLSSPRARERAPDEPAPWRRYSRVRGWTRRACRTRFEPPKALPRSPTATLPWRKPAS